MYRKANPKPDTETQMAEKKAKKQEQSLFGQFPPQTIEEWRSAIINDLKGADYDKRLLWRSYESFTMQPFYTPDDLEGLEYLSISPGRFPFIRGAKVTGNRWEICEEIGVSSLEEANSLAATALERGATSLNFNCAVEDGHFTGVPIQKLSDMEVLLEGIPIDEIPVHFTCGGGGLPILALFAAVANKRGVPLEFLSGSVDTDPIMRLELQGSFKLKRFDEFNEVKTALEFLGENMPRFRCLCVHSRQFHDSGASISQELALGLASGVEYLAELTSMDLKADVVAKHMMFSFPVGTNYFMEISKLRAARLLWSQIVAQFGPEDVSSCIMNIHSKTSMWSQTLYDPYVNMLRATTEAMSAAIGGADTITLSPFDEVFRAPDGFSRRLARNTQLVLKHESYLDKVIDPAAGSYAIENLTDKITEEAWKIFLEIESRGGLIEALKSGYVQREIAEVREKKDTNLAIGRDTSLGTNRFANRSETMLPLINTPIISTPLERGSDRHDNRKERSIETLIKRFESGAKIGDALMSEDAQSEFTVEPLKPYRASQEFETLRLATEAYADRSGSLPKVFLVTMGNLAMRQARANFALNFFGCAGFEVIDNTVFSSVTEAAEAALESGARIVVICSSDEEYAQLAPQICKEIKGNKTEPYIIVAGHPKDIIGDLKAAGVDDFISVRTNAIETLSKYQRLLNIQA